MKESCLHDEKVSDELVKIRKHELPEQTKFRRISRHEMVQFVKEEWI